MDERTLKTLDFESLVALLARHVQTPLGRKRAQALAPSTDRDLINSELDRTTECAGYVATGGVFFFTFIKKNASGTSFSPIRLPFPGFLALRKDVSPRERSPASYRNEGSSAPVDLIR